MPRGVCGMVGIELPGIVAAFTKSVVLHVQGKRAARAPALHSSGLTEQEKAGGCWRG